MAENGDGEEGAEADDFDPEPHQWSALNGEVDLEGDIDGSGDDEADGIDTHFAFRAKEPPRNKDEEYAKSGADDQEEGDIVHRR